MRPPGSPPATLAVHAYVEVTDIEEAVAFYTAALGLTVRRRLTATWVELAGAAIPLHLLGDRPSGFTAGATALERDFARHWTPVHLDFVVPDLAPAVERARAAGATIEREVDHPGFFAMANCADPFGNGFDLIQEHPGGYDALVAATARPT